MPRCSHAIVLRKKLCHVATSAANLNKTNSMETNHVLMLY